MIERHGTVRGGYSRIDLPDARHVHVTALPRAGGDLAGQTREAVESIREAIRDQGPGAVIVRQTVFVADARQVDACRRQIESLFGSELPATTYVAQPPCPAGLVAIEAYGLVPRSPSVRVERASSDVTIAHHDGAAWCYCDNVVAEGTNGSLHAGAVHTFTRMARRLESAGFRFDQVVRTWLYLGDIVGPEADRQRYQELNRARADFYAGVPFPANPAGVTTGNGHFYPASTGIGAEGKGLAMSCLALASRQADVKVVPLENPNQTSAFRYDARYGPSSPSFSRAAAVVAGDAVTVLVSGTASITGAESCHNGDVERQTHQTLDNIAALISPENFAKHGLGAGAGGAALTDCLQLRVYLKNAADYDRVHQICTDRVGPLSAVYSVADVCRPELLVEIEATAVIRRQT